MKKHPNVYRIDIEATPAYPNRHPTHGWQVRIRRQGKQHTKFFSDERCDGRDGALQQAIAYRDELLSHLPEPDDPVARSAEVRSKTGVVGLNFSMKDDGSGRQKPYVQLSWLKPDGTRKSASYSVEKWGLRRALWNACARLHREKDDALDPYGMFRTAYDAITNQYGPQIDTAAGGDGAIPDPEMIEAKIAAEAEA